MSRRLIIPALLIAAAIVAPGISNAVTNDDLKNQIANLLKQVQVLQQQLQVVENSGSTSSVVPITYTSSTPTATGSCASIAYNLNKGDENDEVRKLQLFLAQDPSVYPDAIVSGYFGSLTQRAVQAWQAKHGIVSGGTPATTGYGSVGPKTRSAMASLCNGGSVTSSSAIARSLVVTPEVGPVPLQVTATFSLNGSSCSSYYLDWGDGTQPLLFDAGNTACTNDIAHKRATHTYVRSGVHQITLRAGQGPLSRAGVAGQTFVSVGSTITTGLALSPSTGSVPFTTSITFPVKGSTCTSYEADWGDGTVDRFEPSSFTNCVQDTGTQSLTHTYNNAGTYKVEFKTGNARLSQLPVTGRWDVLVDNTISADASLKIEPTSGIAPLAVKVTLAGYSEACTSYLIDWGDGTQPEFYDGDFENCEGFRFQKLFTHAYTTPGTYTIRTKVGTRTALANIPFNSQSIIVGSLGTVEATCVYPNTPVCGEIVFSCPIGYTCDQSYQTFSNRCEMESANATFVKQGRCDF
ncbi:hypothetical protein JXR01_03325 [Candidatus Kaiserbacteria bacterium]|nr:MAG: hypothetical protein JXR01_03325 [Candidatus Kaiserbacteria bacterium]